MITLKLIGITVLIVLALKIALSKGMLLEKTGKWLEQKVDDGKKIFDIFICPYCMGTLQTITAHLFAFGLGILPLEWDWQLLIRYPLIVFGTSIIAGNFWNVYLTINQVKEKNEIEVEYYKKLMYEIENNNDEGGEDSGAAISP